jgi:protein-S-isoprenylcysteine O-methyltransferase Ste14
MSLVIPVSNEASYLSRLLDTVDVARSRYRCGASLIGVIVADKLATTEIFGLTRNPIYSAWIVFIIPGLVLLSRSWPLFPTPVMAYMIFKARIGRQNEYPEMRFKRRLPEVQKPG